MAARSKNDEAEKEVSGAVCLGELMREGLARFFATATLGFTRGEAHAYRMAEQNALALLGELEQRHAGKTIAPAEGGERE